MHLVENGITAQYVVIPFSYFYISCYYAIAIISSRIFIFPLSFGHFLVYITYFLLFPALSSPTQKISIFSTSVFPFSPLGIPL